MVGCRPFRQVPCDGRGAWHNPSAPGRLVPIGPPWGRAAPSAAAVPTVVEARWPASARACLRLPTIRPRTQSAVAEADFGLGRVDIDIDDIMREVKEQGEQRGGDRTPGNPGRPHGRRR